MDDGTQADPVSPLPTPGDVPATEHDDLTGRHLGDFHILRLLGQGGMGRVYLAEQVSLKRKVALKIMKADLAANATALKRFRIEAEAAARISHANIVQVYASSECEGRHFMALEYVEGRNLREFFLKKGPPDVFLAISIMRQVAAALQRASEQGIVHRDIKPENILLTRKGEVKVADFGLSHCFDGEQQPLHLTQSGVTMGTPLYMSPEQVQGKPIDKRSDIYSFGVSCYHMLAGEPPFHGKTAFEVATQHVQAEATPLQSIRPDLPPELCAVMHKMLAKNPDERQQSGRELLRDLTRLRESLNGVLGREATQANLALAASMPEMPTAAQELPARSVTRPALTVPRRRWLWALAGGTLVLVALATGVALGLWRNKQESSAPSTSRMAQETMERVPLPPTSREKFLLEALKQDINRDEHMQVLRALYDRIELGILYLEQNRLEEADRFFVDLIKNPPPQLKQAPQQRQFVLLGQIGHAIVLAFQDRTVESNKLFLDVLSEKLPEAKRFAGPFRVANRPELRLWIAKAVRHNADNATAEQPFPKELDYLRKPPSPILGKG